MSNRDCKLPDACKDSVHAYEGIDNIDKLLFQAEDEPNSDTGEYFAKQFRAAVNGYAGKIKEDDCVCMIALDAPNKERKGRLSVVYYDEMGGKQYISAIRNWQEHCCWKRDVFIDNKAGRKTLHLDSSPAPYEIALAAFGVLRAKKGKTEGHSGVNGTEKKQYLDADKKLIKKTVERLLPCITQKRLKIPQDIIRAAAHRASQPEAMTNFIWENQVLSVVCAMIRFNYENGEKMMSSFLEDNIKDRSVLFGRLLAVCDYMEIRAYEKSQKGVVQEQRMTNAKRYWNAFSNRPAKTFQIIRQNLIPYEKKLSFYDAKFFEECFEQLNSLIVEAGYDNRGLTEMYLPAYYLQMENMKDYFKRDKQKKAE